MIQVDSILIQIILKMNLYKKRILLHIKNKSLFER
jgi:hypothetical protein